MSSNVHSASLPPPPLPRQVNITKHTLVPQHRILTRDEKQTLLDRYKVRAGLHATSGGRPPPAACTQLYLLLKTRV